MSSLVLAEGEQGIWNVVKQGCQLFSECFKFVWPLMLIASIVGFGVAWLQTQEPIDTTTSLVYSLILLVVRAYLNAILTLICLNHLFQKNVSISALLQPILGKLPMLIVVLLMFIFAFVMGLILLIIPAFIVMVSLLPAATIFLIRPMGPFEAISESHHLVWGHWWRSANVYSVFSLVTLVMLIPIVILAVMLDFGTFSTIKSASESVSLFSAVVTPWVSGALTAVTLVLMHDLLIRKRSQSLAEYVRGE
ncbi:MAG: hypothetical protein ACJAX5_000509 [Patiriisocius sp.]